MKLFVCLFLIVVLLEEYKCAPYRRTRSRYRHHHGLQYGSSRYRSPYRSPGTYYGRYGHGYHPHHPWRGSHHSTWHSPRFSPDSRHHSRLGFRHRPHSFPMYNYHPRHFVPNIPPNDNTENKSSTVVTPTYEVVEKTTVRPESKFTEERIDKSTGKSLNMPLKNLADNIVVEEPVEKSTVKPTTTTTVTATNLANIPDDKPQDTTIEKVTEKHVEKTTVKPTPTVTATIAVKITEDKPQDIVITKANEKVDETSTVKPAPAVTAANSVEILGEAQGWTDEKLEPKHVGNTFDNRLHKSTPNPVKSSFEILSDYSTVSPFNDRPVENLSELSTEFPSVIQILI